MRVQITTAVELNDKQAGNIEQTLQKKLTKKNLSFEYKVDPQVIGGIRVIVGSREFDATLRTKLEQVRQHLTSQL